MLLVSSFCDVYVNVNVIISVSRLSVTFIIPNISVSMLYFPFSRKGDCEIS